LLSSVNSVNKKEKNNKNIVRVSDAGDHDINVIQYVLVNVTHKL